MCQNSFKCFIVLAEATGTKLHRDGRRGVSRLNWPCVLTKYYLTRLTVTLQNVLYSCDYSSQSNKCKIENPFSQQLHNLGCPNIALFTISVCGFVFAPVQY